MPTTLEGIRTALAAQIANNIDGFQTSPYLLSTPIPPAIEVQPGPIEYDLAMQRGVDEWSLIVRAFVALTLDQAAQVVLDQLLASGGAGSMKAAIESDRTLGGVVANAHVVHCSGYRVFTASGLRGRADGPVLGAEWTLKILAAG